MGTTHSQTWGFDTLWPVATAATPGTNPGDKTTYPIIIAVDGDPNTTITAPKGSLALSTAGAGTTSRAWINTDGATAWTSVTTAA